MKDFLKTGWQLWVSLNAKVDDLAIQFLDELVFSQYADEFIDSYDPSVIGSSLGSARLGFLPDELLLAIFTHFVMDCNSPWHLTLVCRRWRALALGAAALWTDITLSDSPPSNAHGIDVWRIHHRIRLVSRGSTTVCETPPVFEDALKRARSAPLRLAVRLSQQNINDLKNWYSVLAQSKGVSVRTLEFDTSPFGVGFLTALCQSVEVRNLEQVVTYAPRGLPPLLITALQTGQRLTSLNVPFELFLRLDRDDVGLHLRLKELATGFPARNLADFDNVISKYQKLHRLRIPFGIWPGCRSPHIKLPLLETLSTQCSPCHLGKVDFPVLQTFFITINDRECLCRYQATASYCFPCLTELNIVPTQETDTAWIRDMKVPLS
ncbi:SubName: Full=Uncharacterized protein {ECO:0000313/EMBL:CCA66962.1} [Serendipita indica DSM 11827]|nr:SubName: Full=Uncharacterized protein {ECO:0000313/EMBL:CCA66962.1} [Serendipita indica DSM 11827]